MPTAASGPIAMNVLCTIKPGLVVLDVCLPGRSGQDLCCQIRRQSKNVPVLTFECYQRRGRSVSNARSSVSAEFLARKALAMARRRARRLAGSRRGGQGPSAGPGRRVPGTGPSPVGWRAAVQKAASRGSAGASPRNFDWQYAPIFGKFRGLRRERPRAKTVWRWTQSVANCYPC
jgi:DNA-binding NtrC family response regulator